MKNEQLAAIRNNAFLQGREYERKLDHKKSVKISVAKCGRELLARFPEKQLPDDGNGDEFNAGYNKALQEIGDIVVDAFGIKKLETLK